MQGKKGQQSTILCLLDSAVNNTYIIKKNVNSDDWFNKNLGVIIQETPGDSGKEGSLRKLIVHYCCRRSNNQ